MARRKHEDRFPPIPTSDTPSSLEAQRARREATQKFVEAAQNGPEVRRIAHEMVRLRRDNHFGDKIARSMGL